MDNYSDLNIADAKRKQEVENVLEGIVDEIYNGEMPTCDGKITHLDNLPARLGNIAQELKAKEYIRKALKIVFLQGYTCALESCLKK